VRNRLILIVFLVAAGAGLYFALSGPGAPDRPRPEAAETTAAAPVPVEFDLVRLSREGMGVIAGTAAPGGFVDVMSEGRSIGKSRASDTGSWEIVLANALAPGTHVLSLAATDAAGRETRSADVTVVAVPPPPSKGPDLKTAKGEKKPAPEDGVLAVMLPRQGEAPGRVLQRPGQLKPALALGIDTADFDAAGRTVLTGRASAGNEVNVYVDGHPVGTAKAGDEGTWSMTVPSMRAAAHNVRLEEIDPGNAVVLNVNQAFDPAVTLASDGNGKPAFVWPDETVWHVVRRQTGGSLRYTQIFRPDQGVADDDDKVKMPGVLKPGSSI
jgi:hypothetical protein